MNCTNYINYINQYNTPRVYLLYYERKTQKQPKTPPFLPLAVLGDAPACPCKPPLPGTRCIQANARLPVYLLAQITLLPYCMRIEYIYPYAPRTDSGARRDYERCDCGGAVAAVFLVEQAGQGVAFGCMEERCAARAENVL